MEKNAVFVQRKELKKKAHAVLRSHYIVLIFLMLLMALFGTEFTFSTSDWRNSGKAADPDDPGSVLEDSNNSSLFSASEVLSFLTRGLIDEGVSKAEENEEEIMKTEGESEMLGRSEGVLASLVNGVSSGRLFAKVAQGIRTITHSDKAVALFFILGSILWYALIFIFIKNIYSAAIRRVFLEARIYKNISVMDVLFFGWVRRWRHASWVMLVKEVFQTLWDLTIIGGIIKYYSYFAVPYIVAENPSLKAKETITLSRKMMNGHKMELFKFQFTMIGWILLGVVTYGISDLVYGAGYRMACYAEFYERIRALAKENGIEGAELLDDQYLFEKADRILLYETYFDVVDEITVLHENQIALSGRRKVIADWFGIWTGILEEKKAYYEQEERSFSIRWLRLSMEGSAYPLWLNSLWKKQKEIKRQGNFSFLRNYTIWTLFLLFISFAFAGWTWEVALHFIQTGEFANRGTLYGPWLPIYGTGGVIVLILCSRFRKKPVAEFFTAILLCGILEYTSGWYLETRYHQRWWSYDGYFLNLHGRICAEGLLVFGVGCCVVVYLLAPLADYYISKLNRKVLLGICISLMLVFGVDMIYSSAHPNTAKGATEESMVEEAHADMESTGGVEGG